MNLFLKLLILLSFLTAVFFNISKFQSTFNYQKTKNDFNNSPYILSDKYSVIISDEDYYAWQGVNYAKRSNMDETIYDHPPFGKLLIGLSILATGNQNVIQIFVSLFTLISFYFLSKEVLKSTFFSLLATLSLSLEPLFREQISTSLLDIELLLFLTLTLLFSLKCLINKKWMVFSMISLGLFSSIKFPANAVIVGLTIFLFLLIIKRFDVLKSFIQYLIIVPIIYFILYIPFIDKPSISKFLELQIFGIKWHRTHLPNYPKFEIFRILFFNKWRTWWGSEPFITVPYFHLGWPLSTLLTFTLSILAIFKRIKIDKEILLILLWSIFYLLGSSLRVVFPRYLLLGLPYLYIIVLYLINYAYRYRWQRSKHSKEGRK